MHIFIKEIGAKTDPGTIRDEFSEQHQHQGTKKGNILLFNAQFALFRCK